MLRRNLTFKWRIWLADGDSIFFFPCNLYNCQCNIPSVTEIILPSEWLNHKSYCLNSEVLNNMHVGLCSYKKNKLFFKWIFLTRFKGQLQFSHIAFINNSYVWKCSIFKWISHLYIACKSILKTPIELTTTMSGYKTSKR